MGVIVRVMSIKYVLWDGGVELVDKLPSSSVELG